MSQYRRAIDYLPHQSPMVVLETVCYVSAEHVECEVIVTPEGVLAPFLNTHGALPAWFAIEMMAQTIGVWRGWHGEQSGTIPKLGLLLGSRAFNSSLSEFPAASQLRVYATMLLQDDKLANFDCWVSLNGEAVTTARLNVYQPSEHEINQLIQQGNSL